MRAALRVSERNVFVLQNLDRRLSLAVYTRGKVTKSLAATSHEYLASKRSAVQKLWVPSRRCRPLVSGSQFFNDLNHGIWNLLFWNDLMLHKCSHISSAAHLNYTSDLAQEEERLVDAAGFRNIFCASLRGDASTNILWISVAVSILNLPHQNKKIDLKSTNWQWICQHQQYRQYILYIHIPYQYINISIH